MPTATKRTPNSPVKSPTQGGLSSSSLRLITKEEMDQRLATLCNTPPCQLIFEFFDLDEPHEYPFKDQDPVWIRTKEDNWCYGRVNGNTIRVGPTRYSKQGLFYPVIFGLKSHVRKFFAPTNGEMKPDTAQVRLLLQDAGWLDD